MNIKLIAAASLNGVIGHSIENKLPWNYDYPEDLAFFKKCTINSTVIMGRNTFNSIGRVLPTRRNIVLTKRIVPRMSDTVDSYISLERALETCKDDVWIIGGAQVYQKGLEYAQEIYITTIPRIIDGDNLIYMPYINPSLFSLVEKLEISKEKNLYCNIYNRTQL